MKKIFLKNFFNLIINQGVNILVAIIATPILFQKLGESSFGLMNLSFSILMLLSIIVSYGYHLNGPKRIAEINNSFSIFNFTNDIISLRVLIALVLSLVIVFVCINTNIFESYDDIMLFSIPILFSEAIHPIFYLQGRNNFSVQALLNFISKIIFLGFIVFFYRGFK